MRFEKTEIPGVFVLELERHEDDRGFFARTWCVKELEDHGLNPRLVQVNVGFSHRAGTLRGVHYQTEPAAEVKIARCTRGALFDIALDLSPGSPTFKNWVGVELSAANGRQLYIPEGCAHGYQTLEDDTELCYLTSEIYAPDCAGGVRYDDPAFGIEWPIEVTRISDGDRSWPLFDEGSRSK